MRHKPMPALLLLAAISVTGCQNEAPPAPVPTDSAVSAPAVEQPATAEDTWDGSAAPVAGTRIHIQPDPVPFCDGPHQTVEVQWDVEAAEPAHLQLWIESRAGKRTLWVATKALAGSKQTGPWVTEGMKFVALDARGERVLNTAIVTASDCP